MRENMGLYRGKRMDNGEWIEGSLVMKIDPLLEISYCFILAQGRKDSFVTWHKVDPATVGTYTGMKDKNGKRIFEGDILLLDDIKGFVNYGTGCFCVRMLKPDYLYRGNPAIDIVLNEYPGLEVIGNIHDNPELLEGGDGV